MKLFTALPARKDGTLNVSVKDGTSYKFTGQPLSCDVEDEDHLDQLEALGFMGQQDFEDEQSLQKRIAEREAKRAARAPAAGVFVPGLGAGGAGGDDGDDDFVETGTGVPLEANTAPTGKVRRARK